MALAFGAVVAGRRPSLSPLRPLCIVACLAAAPSGCRKGAEQETPVKPPAPSPASSASKPTARPKPRREARPRGRAPSAMKQVVLDTITGSGFRKVKARRGPALMKPAPFVLVADGIPRLPGDLLVAGRAPKRTEDFTNSALIDVRRAVALAEFKEPFHASIPAGYLSVGWRSPGAVEGWQLALVRLADGRTTPLTFDLPSAVPVKRDRVLLFRREKLPWAFAEGADGQVFAGPIREVPEDGRIELRAPFPALPGWPDHFVADVAWKDGPAPTVHGQPCRRVHLLPDGRFRCREGVAFYDSIAVFEELGWTVTSRGVTDRDGREVSLADGCSASPVAVLRQPPRILAECRGAGAEAESRFLVWSPKGSRGWMMKAADSSSSWRVSDLPVWAGPGPLIDGRRAHTEWVDLERGVRYSTKPLVPVAYDTDLYERLIPVVSDDDPGHILALDLERGTLERAFEGTACKGWYERLDQHDGVAIIGCLTRELPYEEGDWSLVLNMKARTVARAPARLQRMTSSGLIVGRVVQGRTSTLVRVDVDM